MTDSANKTSKSFQCREALWQKFEQMAKELECSVDYLINDAMKQYARQRGYTTTAAAEQQTSAAVAGAAPPPPPPPSESPETLAAPPGPPPPGPPPRKQTSGAHPDPTVGSHAGPPPAPPATHGSGARPAPGSSGSGAVPFPPPPPGKRSAFPAAPPPPPARRSGSQSGPLPIGAQPGAPAPAAPPQRPGAAAAAQPASAQPATGASQSTPPAASTLSILYEGERFPITKDRFIIGRGKQTSDLTIKDPNVSRQHAMVEFSDGNYYIVDLGSTNGVEHEGQRVQRKVIQEGDVFRVCDHELLFSFQPQA